jgi:S1-C subfamily serine protease
VVAINSMVIGPRMALSIPSQAVTDLLDQARERPILGVVVQAAPLPAGLGQPTGLLITAVEDGGAADAAGLLPGDLLLTLLPTGAAGAPAPIALIEPGDLARALARAGRGQALVARLLRGGRVVQQTIVPVAMRAAA